MVLMKQGRVESMTTISAALVKELRERTGAGMMECKQALIRTGGNLEAAIEDLRTSGMARADRKAGRQTAEGRIVLGRDGAFTVLLEVNCETDFVGKDTHFIAFVEEVARIAAHEHVSDITDVPGLAWPEGGTIEEARRLLVARLGENISLRRLESSRWQEGPLGVYVHGHRIGVFVELVGGDETLARDLAMHVAASRPLCVAPEDVPSALVESERKIYEAQAAESGKSPDIVRRMVEGRLRKYLDEVTLLGQPFVKDPETKVGELLRRQGARVQRFARLEVGEGIARQACDFAAEVQAQLRT